MQTRLSAPFGRGLFRRLTLPLLTVSALGLAALPGRAATLITYWDFDNGNPNYNSGTTTLGKLNALDGLSNGETYNETVTNSAGILHSNNLGSRAGTLTVAMNGSYGVTTSTSPSWGLFTGSTTNLASGDTAGAGNSLFMEGKSTTANDSLLFTLSSTGYSGLSFTFGERMSSNNNQAVVTWYVNTTNDANLANWTVLTLSGTPGFGGTTYNTMSLSLPGTYDNSSTLYLQAVVSFAGTATGNSVAFDNVQLTGTAVPEPATVALLAAGGAVLFWSQRRRLAFV